MALLQNTYGKGRVRVLRLYRDGQYHEPRETSAKVLLEGDFSGSYTGPDNSTVIATDFDQEHRERCGARKSEIEH